jgi:hypothetical protein
VKNQFFIQDYRVFSILSYEVSSVFIDQIIYKRLNIKEVYKDSKKCLVAKFKCDILDDYLIIKVPRARSNQIWERFLTLFRYGESIRLFNDLQKMKDLGFNGPLPVLAAERRRYGVVVDGFIIYYYIEGRIATPDDVDLIAPEL